MYRFIKKIFLFLIPIATILFFPGMVIWLGREYYSVDRVIKNQTENQKTIFNFAYSDPGNSYKRKLVDQVNPDILVLGTSRVLQIRSSFASEPYKLVNTGPAVRNIDDMNNFVHNLPANSNIKVIILGLDQNMFSLPYPTLDTSTINSSNSLEKFSSLLLDNWKKIYRDYLNHKFSIKDLWNSERDKIGLNTIINGNGFRGDGSYQYARTLNDPDREKNLANEIERVKNIIKANRSNLIYKDNLAAEEFRSYVYTEKTPPSAMEGLNSFLALCKNKDIYVAGLMPPFAGPIYQEMISGKDLYAERVLALPKELSPVFSKYGFSFYNFTNGKIVGASDNEFLDPGHGTDKFFLRAIIYMGERDPNLKKYFNPNQLKKILEKSKKPFLEI